MISPMSILNETEVAAEPWLEIVRRKVGNLRFGSVQIVVHEGRVTQVESTEKTRLSDAGSTNGSSSSYAAVKRKI
ncbi:hypothetical protein DES53_103170 [Roseimicrobium gellanilyticum]|uniref:DUF2292 domain-containing protein n=2 Tax=Roseimicrobium gellanilyticum TaxID=748857 RepID=A0A366HQG5_9BACT|nr:hypothetical protein DES53_103170 [Roseimicrobium gellanilyticum]